MVNKAPKVIQSTSIQSSNLPFHDEQPRLLTSVSNLEDYVETRQNICFCVYFKTVYE